MAVGAFHNVVLIRAGPPSRLVLGENPMAIECGSVFGDPGARATDVGGADLTSKIIVTGGINAHQLGSYILVYTVKTDMELSGGRYHFNLDTGNFSDASTQAGSRYYRSTITVVDHATQALLGGAIINLETGK